MRQNLCHKSHCVQRVWCIIVVLALGPYQVCGEAIQNFIMSDVVSSSWDTVETMLQNCSCHGSYMHSTKKHI